MSADGKMAGLAILGVIVVGVLAGVSEQAAVIGFIAFIVGLAVATGASK